MAYKNKLVAAIQVNGKSLKEKNEIVELPFKSEYSIYLKNLETTKCRINITIDGTNVTEGGLVINSLSFINLERFLDNRKFKFIEKSRKIEDFSGNKPEDGIIEIKYSFEKPSTDIPSVNSNTIGHHYHHPNYYHQQYYQPQINPYWPGVINNDDITVKDSKFKNIEVGPEKTMVFKLVSSDEIITKS